MPLRLPCSQMPLPPQSLHWLLCLPCSQMPLPPQSLHRLLCLPCVQMPPPPQSLHRLLCLPCSHFARFRSLLSPAEAALLFRASAPSMSDVPPFSDCFAELVATEADATGFGASLATIVDAAEAADVTCSATSVRTWSQEGWDGERDGGGGERRDESARLGKYHHHHNTQARSPRKSGWWPPPTADRDHERQGGRRG